MRSCTGRVAALIFSGNVRHGNAIFPGGATATFTLHEIDQPLVPGRGYWVWTPADVVIQLPR
jgi:hypothetical protein